MLDSKNIKEKRKHSRFYMDLPVEYRVTDTPHLHGALAVNASEAGLLIQSAKSIPIGSKLNITVLFPDGFELANFEVFAEIVWKEGHWQESREEYKYGLKFIHLLNEDHRKLKSLLFGGNEPETA